jgi:hypothetical protein
MIAHQKGTHESANEGRGWVVDVSRADCIVIVIVLVLFLFVYGYR